MSTTLFLSLGQKHTQGHHKRLGLLFGPFMIFVRKSLLQMGPNTTVDTGVLIFCHFSSLYVAFLLMFLLTWSRQTMEVLNRVIGLGSDYKDTWWI